MPSKGPKRKKGSFPPNPKQWQSEEHGLRFRDDFKLSSTAPIAPRSIVDRCSNVDLWDGPKLRPRVSERAYTHLYGSGAGDWDAFTFTVPGDITVIILNDTRPPTRQKTTIMEELFHIVLGHQPSKIVRCEKSGLSKRTYNPAVERQAKWAAGAALLPYAGLRSCVNNGHSVESIADLYEVSTALVMFRLRVTKIKYRAA